MEESIRIQAIDRHRKGDSPKAIYTDMGKSQNWFFKWLKRFQTGDPHWYKDKSRALKNLTDSHQRS